MTQRPQKQSISSATNQQYLNANFVMQDLKELDLYICNGKQPNKMRFGNFLQRIQFVAFLQQEREQILTDPRVARKRRGIAFLEFLGFEQSGNQNLLEKLSSFSLLFVILNFIFTFFSLFVYYIFFYLVYLVMEDSLSGFTISMLVGDCGRSLLWEMADVRSTSSYSKNPISSVISIFKDQVYKYGFE